MTIEGLRKVPYLSPLDDATLAEIVARAERARYAPKDCIVSELESGADVFVVVSGEVEVFVEPRDGERRTLGRLGPGSAFGEMASLTGELRSASVEAITEVEVVILADADFDRLRERRPEVAVALVGVLGARLASAELSIDALLEEKPTPCGAATAVVAAAGAGGPQRGSIARAWRELVVGRRRDLGFLALAGFALTLVATRVLVHVAFRFDLAPRELLRSAYILGFLLLGGSALTALLTFRPQVRRAVALAYGVGCALIANELGVTLAFDIFFKDIHTADPNAPFDVERLYRRTEPLRAIAIGLLVLIQAAYLRPFYRRAWFVVRTRLRALLSSESRA